MPIVADAAVAVRGDLTQFNRDIKNADKPVQGLGQRIKGILSPQNLATAGVVGATVAFTALAAGVTEGFRSLINLERINAQTDAAIKSTGGAANVTRAEIEGLAESTEKLTGIQRETVQEGANLLLTFKRIRNEAGKGNDIFDRATTTALDLSVALGTDMRSASMMLGKALDDPIRGVTALRRAGVALTAQQQEQVKAFVASGDVLSAQKLILAELETQVGESAEAFGRTTAGKLQKFQNVVGDIFENIALGLVDAFETGGAAVNNFALDFGDMGDRIHLIADRAGVDFQTVKDSVQYNMTEAGMSFEEAANAADEEFGTITRSTEELVTESGEAWDTYQSQIRATNREVNSQLRAMTGSMQETFDLWHTYVVDLALNTPGDIAGALEDGRDAVKMAADALARAQAEALEPSVEKARLIAQLAGSELAAGLLSTDPIVRRRAQDLRDSIYARLGQLGDDAWTWGNNVGNSFGNGLISAQGYVNDKANQLKQGVQRFLEFAGSPAYTHSREIGENVGASWVEGIAGTAIDGLRGLAPALSIAGPPAPTYGFASGNGMTGGDTYILQVEGKPKEVATRDELFNAFDQLSGFGAGY